MRITCPKLASNCGILINTKCPFGETIKKTGFIIFHGGATCSKYAEKASKVNYLILLISGLLKLVCRVCKKLESYLYTHHLVEVENAAISL